MYIGAIEAGGTKFVCAVSDEHLQVVERISLPTGTPEETLAKVFEFFDRFTLKAIGIGSFGPIDVNPESKTYGYITSTPKPGWKNFDFLGAMQARYPIPMGWTTDVNAAALGELTLGAAQGLDSCIYLTVGTGIGGGAVVKGQLVEGFGHPEMGHMIPRRHPDDHFEGFCPYHGDCLEGLAAGPAIEKRSGTKAFDLAKDDPAWKLEAYYLAQAIMTYALVQAPGKIILGGGVMKQEHLFPLIEKELERLMNGYAPLPKLASPKLGDNAGITGCFVLAKRLVEA